MERRRSVPRAFWFSLCALGLASAPVLAGNDAWSVVGQPSGGTVSRVVIDPANTNILYSISDPGVFESTDAGVSWTLIYQTLNVPNDLKIDPQNPNTLYVAYQGEGVIYKTTDGGATWAEMDKGIASILAGQLDEIMLLAVDPVNEGTLYAGSMQTGVYKSVDGGAHWAAINTGITQLVTDKVYPQQLMVDPVNPLVLYMSNVASGGSGAGLYTSTDAGGHWTITGLTGLVNDVEIDPASHTHLVTCSPNGFESSIDSGATWTAGAPCPAGVNFLRFDPSNSNHILVGFSLPSAEGLYQTTDGGATFTQLPAFTVQAIDLAFDPVHPANLYAGVASWGLFKSADGGSTWQFSDAGIDGVVPNLMLEGSDDVLYLASAGSGIYKSSDQGVSWAQVGGGMAGSLPASAEFPYALVEDPTATTTLYAGTTSSILKTVDGGDTWTESDTGIPNPYVLAMALDPERPQTLYAGSGANGAYGVYKSTDGGANWTSASTGLPGGQYTDVQALAVDPKDSNTVYCGLYSGGMYQSVDGGKTWVADQSGMPATEVWAIAVDPSDHETVYASTDLGMYKSSDAGSTWTLSNTGMTGYIMTDIQIDPHNTSDIYVTPRYGIGDAFMSADGGATWSDMSGGLSAASAESVEGAGHARTQAVGTGNPVIVSVVAVDPVHKNQVYGGGNDGRIYVYQNNAKSGGGSGSGSGSSSSGGGGGGAVPLFSLLFLLGLGFMRRRRG